MGHFEELDAYVGALADQYRAQGPPTLLYVALTMLGNSALFQGNAEQADQLFDESASLDVPDRTSGDFGALAYRTLVADAANKIAASSGHTPDLRQHPGQRLDARQALVYMRDVLNELSDDQQSAS